MAADFGLLGPDIILAAVERDFGLSLEPLVTSYNSYVNRVFALRDQDGTRYISKFYRPGRWTREAIQEEHDFLFELSQAEIPVVPPLRGPRGSSLHEVDGICFALFPFRSGRTFDIAGDQDYLRLGSLVGRLHSVARASPGTQRPCMSPLGMSMDQCRALAATGGMEREMAQDFLALCSGVLGAAQGLFDAQAAQRIHGDCHRGNVLDRLDQGLLLIDFDDMMRGPAIQDLWLLLPDRISQAGREMDLLLEGYTRFCQFPSSSLALVEYLRFMRIIYYLAWCSSQRGDRGFAERYPDWGSRAFWIKEFEDLSQQARYL